MSEIVILGQVFGFAQEFQFKFLISFNITG